MKTKTTCRAAPKLLVPIDFTEYSRQAAQAAVPLANILGATLVTVYVVEANAPGSEFIAKRRLELDEDLSKIARKELLKFRRSQLPKLCTCEYVVRSGQPDIEILAVANEISPAMIVMPAHGKDSEHGQLGRTAERVAARAPCPVLLVPLTERCVPFFI